MTRRVALIAASLAALAIGGAVGVAKAESQAGGRAASSKLPKITVGYINYLKGIESADRQQRTMTAAVKALGWKIVPCDGQGNPTQMGRCVSSLLAQRVDVIVANGIDPSLIAGPLRDAKKQHVPAISVGGMVSPSPLYQGEYYPNERQEGKTLAAWLVRKLGAVKGEKTIAINDFPATWCTTRTAQLRVLLKSHPEIKIVADQTTDATNIIAGTRKQVGDTLTQYPNLSAYWFCFDTAGQAGGQAVAAQYPGKTFPSRPLVVTFHADPSTQQLIKEGAIDAVVDNNYDAAGWVAADQLAEYFGHHRPFSKSPAPKYPVQYYEYTIVTKANLPAPGHYVQPKANYVQFFKNKWKREFGVG